MAVQDQRPQRNVGAALFYGLCSIWMTIVNKWVLTTFGFSFTNTLLLWQNATTIAMLQCLSKYQMISMEKFQVEKARRLLPLSLSYTANVFCALSALSMTSVPVYNALKRTTPLTTMVVDYGLRGVTFSAQVQLAVYVMVVGAVVTGWGDLDFDLLGYMLAIISCCLQALYLVLASHNSDLGLDTFSILNYNCMLSMPFLALLSYVTEWDDVKAYAHYDDAAFLLCLGTCLGVGSLLNYSLFLCTTTNSALTTTIVGCTKGVAATILGFFLFGKINLSAAGVFGVTLNTVGGVLYVRAKYVESVNRKRSNLAVA